MAVSLFMRMIMARETMKQIGIWLIYHFDVTRQEILHPYKFAAAYPP